MVEPSFARTANESPGSSITAYGPTAIGSSEYHLLVPPPSPWTLRSALASLRLVYQ